MAGDRRIGQHHMRIYGQAMKVGGQIARVSTTWNVVNRHAVEWASNYTFKRVTELTNSFQAALRDTISRGIAEGKAMPTIGRELRQRRDFMLNHVQRGALDKYHNKLTDRFSQMRGGLTDKRAARIDRMVRREGRKKLRYRGEMIARTETARAMSEGTLESYKVAEIDWIQFEASGDACLECADLDGNMYRRGEGAGIIPVHVNCLLSYNVPVYTADGWKKIGEVAVGDLVLTHKGRFRKVLHLHRTPKQKPMIISVKIKKPVKWDNILITADHPMIVNGKWKYAKDICVGDRVRAMAKPCSECGRLFPLGKNKFCGKSCFGKAHTKMMLNKYESGAIDRFATTKKANEKMRRSIADGTWHLQGPRPEQSGENNPAKRPEIREKIRLGKLGKKNPRHKSKHSAEYWEANSRDKREYYRKHPEKHPNAILARKSREKVGEKTYIEEVMGQALLDASIDAEYNHPVDSLWIDYAIVDRMIAIECDGAYWHQDKDKEKRRDDRLESHGWTVLHFTGSEIEADIGACISKVQRVLMNHDGDYQFGDFEIVVVDSYVPKKARTLYNLSVEEDESYIAKGFVVANCRCSWKSVGQEGKPRRTITEE